MLFFILFIYLLSFYPTGLSCIIYSFQFRCVNDWVSASTCFLCLFLGSFPSVLSDSNVTVFVLSYYYPLEGCLFPDERQKGAGFRWEGRWRETGRNRDRRNCNQDVRKTLFSKEEKKIKNWNTSYLSSLPFGQSHHYTPLGHCGSVLTDYSAALLASQDWRHSALSLCPREAHHVSPCGISSYVFPVTQSKPRGFSRPVSAILSGSPVSTGARSAAEGNSSSSSRSFLKCHLLQVLPDFPLCNALSPPIWRVCVRAHMYAHACRARGWPRAPSLKCHLPLTGLELTQ